MKVVFFDIEATDLNANWGRLLCCSFADLDSDEVVTLRADERRFKGANAIDDSKLAVAVRDRLESADIIVGWNSKLYDVPFINARLVKASARPCRLAKNHGVMHVDAMWYAGGQSMRIGSKRLDTVSRFLGTEAEKTPIEAEAWVLAATGHKPSLDLVVEHCEADVKVLKAVFPSLAEHVKNVTFTLNEVSHLLHLIPSRKN